MRHGHAVDEVAQLAQSLQVQTVYANHDQPAALARDAQVLGRLAHIGMALHTFKDHVMFVRDKVLTLAGTPFGDFTPIKNAWLKKLNDFYLQAYPVAEHARALAPLASLAEGQGGVPTLADIGFAPTSLASAISRCISTTSTSPPTTAAGNGRRRPAATRSLAFASSTPSHKAKRSTPTGASYAATFQRWRACPTNSIHAPCLAKPVVLAAAGVVLGRNYPAPIVKHVEARARTHAPWRVTS